MKTPIKVAILGCGSRGQTYAKILALFPERYQITAAADHSAVRTTIVAECETRGNVQEFFNETDFFAAGKLADILIIATQDAFHFEQTRVALNLGYDILLEKPAATTLEECEILNQQAVKLGRRIALCFVLRYTPFYSTIKRLISEGQLGEIISMRSHEGVEPYHQAHSFVRGHWRKAAESTPMIVAKCSHDADMLCWLSNSSVKSISSYGALSWFRQQNAPAGAPLRCTDGCPAAESCIYDSHRYLGDRRKWLGMVMDHADAATDEHILDFLKTSPWGRCVYRCDNDVVDHQVVACEMENGVSLLHSMTAFDYGRSIEIYGSKASLKGGLPYTEGGAHELWLRDHRTGDITPIEVPKPSSDGYAGHGGGDYGMISGLDDMFYGENAIPAGLDGLAGHQLAFSAEQARLQ